MMNITLTPELKAMIERKVASGLYHSASEVVREALRLLEERERVKEDRLAALRAEVQIGLEQLDRGEYIIMDDQALEDIKARGRKQLDEAKARKKHEQAIAACSPGQRRSGGDMVLHCQG